jgi:hypothetical protein
MAQIIHLRFPADREPDTWAISPAQFDARMAAVEHSRFLSGLLLGSLIGLCVWAVALLALWVWL